MKTYYVDYIRDDTSDDRRYKSEVGIDLLYSDVQKIRAETFEKSQIDEIVQWGFNDSTKERNLVDTDLYKEKKPWFDKHNHAYWSWKPYIINEALESANDGDIVVYWDCNPIYPKFTKSFIPFLEYINDNYEMVAGLEQFGLVHRKYTKSDCFELMGCTDEKYTKGRRKQIQASWSVWKKTPKTMEVVNDWLYWCKNENVVACDVENICGKPNASKFLGHRRDQSVLTNIAVTHKCPVIASRFSKIKLSSWFGKNLNKIAHNYEKCNFKFL